MTKRQKQPDSPTIRAMKTLSQREAGWLVGLTDRQLRNCPDCPRRADGKYDATAVVQWHVEKQTEDPMVVGGDSESLERWRRSRALESETRTLRLMGELADAAEMRAACEALLTPIREFARRMILDRRIDPSEWLEAVGMSDKELAKLRPPDVAKRELHVLPHGEDTPIVVDLLKLAQEEDSET